MPQKLYSRPETLDGAQVSGFDLVLIAGIDAGVRRKNNKLGANALNVVADIPVFVEQIGFYAE